MLHEHPAARVEIEPVVTEIKFWEIMEEVTRIQKN